MIRFILCSALFIVGLSNVQAQKKSELINQNQELKYKLDSVSRIVSTAQHNEKLGLQRADELQVQVTELQDANATLMKNLNSFAALSSQNSENINKTLATLERKEQQLKGITDAISRNDSTALVILTNTKQVVGENAKVGVSDGTVIISEKLDFFFTDGVGINPSSESKGWLENVAKVANANPKSIITIASLNITGEMDIAIQQATAIASILIKDYGVNGERIIAVAQDGGLRESLQIKFEADYKAFYDMAKGSAKN
jgi:seryl-tRNA synthetase